MKNLDLELGYKAAIKENSFKLSTDTSKIKYGIMGKMT